MFGCFRTAVADPGGLRSGACMEEGGVVGIGLFGGA